MHEPPARSPALVAVVALAWLLFGWAIVTTFSWTALLLLPLVVAAADLFSALVHLLFDTLPEHLPIAKDFHLHHREPMHVLRQGYVEYVLRSVYVFVPVMGVVLWSPLPATVQFFIATWGMVVVHNELFHGWAHHPSPPAGVARLQELGFLMHPKHHQQHHAYLDRNYGVINGWSDPLVNTLLNVARGSKARGRL